MKRDMNYGKRVTEEFQRDALAKLLADCTEEQRHLHRAMYPGGVPAERLAWAITQAHNSVLANSEKGGTLCPQQRGQRARR